MTGRPRSDDLLLTEGRYVSPAARLDFPPLVIAAGKGARFSTVDGTEFLDFHSMACVLNTGHNHPRVVAAIRDQADRLLHVNPGYATHEPLIELARRLAGLVPGERDRRVAFGLSGSDANDGALKLVRAATGRWRVFAYDNAYHGTTYGALSLSSVSLNMRRGFGPEVPGVHRIPFPDTYRGVTVTACLETFEQQLRTTAPPDEVAAVFLEPIQGDSGILVPPQDYIDGLRRICSRHGILIVAEEVQTGIGRTGRTLASEHFGLVPDVVVLAKALGSGMPISAIIADSALMESWKAPGHVFSTGANPISCVAALATLDVLEEEGLAERAVAMGAILRAGLLELAGRHPQVGEIRGHGLMLGVDLITGERARERHRSLAAAVVAGCLSRGLYVTFLCGNVLRLAPPLTITEQEVCQALEILGDALDDAVAGRVPAELVENLHGW